MTEPTHAVLMYRLGQLERVNRRWKVGAGAAAVILGLMVLLGAAKKDTTNDGSVLAYSSGNRYLTAGEDDMAVMWKLGYVTGVLDAFSAHAAAAPEYDMAVDVSRCIRSRYQQQLSVGQVQAIVEGFLRDHPELWDLPMPALISFAFFEVCQNSRSPGKTNPR